MSEDVSVSLRSALLSLGLALARAYSPEVRYFVFLLAALGYLLSFVWIFDLVVLAVSLEPPARLQQLRRLWP
jgi:hypothetical protein